jgi:copper chaperone
MTQTVTVTGMSCTGCESNVEEALESIPDLAVVDVDHTENTLTVDGDVDPDAIRAAIDEAGYEAQL